MKRPSEDGNIPSEDGNIPYKRPDSCDSGEVAGSSGNCSSSDEGDEVRLLRLLCLLNVDSGVVGDNEVENIDSNSDSDSDTGSTTTPVGTAQSPVSDSAGFEPAGGDAPSTSSIATEQHGAQTTASDTPQSASTSNTIANSSDGVVSQQQQQQQQQVPQSQDQQHQAAPHCDQQQHQQASTQAQQQEITAGGSAEGGNIIGICQPVIPPPIVGRTLVNYLNRVKLEFLNRPGTFNDFLDTWIAYRQRRIDTPAVIERVTALFDGHPVLMNDFNNFLPEGFRMPPPTRVAAVAEPHISEVPYSIGIQTALAYVNKVKKHYRNQVDKYKEFHEILNTFQDKLNIIKNGGSLYGETIQSAGQLVHAQMAQLFGQNDRLLREFEQFLPVENNPQRQQQWQEQRQRWEEERQRQRQLRKMQKKRSKKQP